MGIILRDALTRIIQPTKAALCFCIPLIGGLEEPARRLDIVLSHTGVTVTVENANITLSWCVSLFGRLEKPLYGSTIIPYDAKTLRVEMSNAALDCCVS